MSLDQNFSYFFPSPIPQQHQDHGMIGPSDSAEVPVTAANTNVAIASLVYGLSHLKYRVHQVQALVGVLAMPDHEPVVPSLAVATMGKLIQEIKGTATSMMFYCQQLNLGQVPSANHSNNSSIHYSGLHGDGQLGLCHDSIDNFYAAAAGNFSTVTTAGKSSQPGETSSRLVYTASTNRRIDSRITDNFEIIELDVADLLAKYTHFCRVCGKGFKRGANLRMHMRAHGDEYKTSATLSKPVKSKDDNSGRLGKKYSCPQEGCRWNRNHPKFQPLKSMICMKNHYKRSHCPKIYVCNRCSRKRFSVLSDLRTHEKHCGDVTGWRCTCGTTFSRKDKLMGHVSLFNGHSPAVDDGGMKRSTLAMQVVQANHRQNTSLGCDLARVI